MGLGCRNPISVCLCSLFFNLGTLALVSQAATSIAPGDSITDNQTIISSDQKFELGFFSPANSTAQYVGIWYYNFPERTVIWVANRESPISGKNGSLTIGEDGNLVILEGDGKSIWSTNVSVAPQNSTATLRGTGNLVLTNGSGEEVLWQSFDHPSDTFLPNMEVHMNVQTGENRTFTSWRSAGDPSPGNYTMGLDPRASPQIVIWQQNSRRWRSGHWDGQIFMGVPRMRTLASYGFKLTQEGDGRMYFTYITLNVSHMVRFIVSWNGTGQQLLWNQDQMKWDLLTEQPSKDCDVYNKCGNFGVCGLEGSPLCQCLDGYGPNNEDQWNQGNWSAGCTRSSPLPCERNSTGGTFSPVEWAKLPDFADEGEAGNTDDCRAECLQNCSCNAYAFVDAIGCMIWTRDLVDIEKLTESGATLYVRIANSGGKSKISKIGIIAIVLSGAFIMSISIWLLWRYRMKMRARSNSPQRKDDPPIIPRSGSKKISTECSGQDPFVIEGTQGNGPELKLFSFNSIAIATNDFANENKLGKGGFGPVHKGILPEGQVIAVKRLSRWSGQGLEEFKNEIILIAKLQHRNLVRLLGCCIEGEERMLIYEYMPNKSLDSFLFDPAKQAQLDWRKRFEIIGGIARGLVYLHRDSRLRIIHRDLKASNILLDEEMNPKISDFGMARIFGGNQHEANTVRVVGTYGYMAPEYAMEGLFSTKSDVYSFGVLLLEIVSGQRNTSFRSLENLNLIRHAWSLWNDGKATELIDPSIADSSSPDEVTRCVHVGMLCVQESAGNRPSMSSVVLMLESAGSTLPTPKQPSFTSMSLSADSDLIVEGPDFPSSNDVTVTEVVGR